MPEVTMAASIPKLYRPEEETFCADGREQRLLSFIRSHARYNFMGGNPVEILAAIDEYGHERDFLMNVGARKGQIICDEISKIKPEVMVELGGYVGYSTILFGDAVRKSGGRSYISLEQNSAFASVATELVELAGLSDIVDIRVNPCAESLLQLRKEAANTKIDALFLDHDKKAYIEDLALCEQLTLVRPGSVVIADNVVSPGAPLYLEYVRGTQSERVSLLKRAETLGRKMEHSLIELQYENTLYDSFEPTGEPDSVMVSICQST